MKACEGKLGRIFMVRLEDENDAVQVIEQFASAKDITTAQIFMVGKETLAGIVTSDGAGKPRLRLPADFLMDKQAWADAELFIQEIVGIDFRRITDPRSGRETLARIVSTKTRMMEKAAPVPDEPGPGTIPVYLFNAEFN